MKRLLIPSSIVLLLSFSAISCVPKPRMNYSKDQLGKLEETQELMRALYHDLSPVWEGAKKETLAPADLKAMSGTAQRVDAIATALASKNMAGKYKAGFTDQAAALGQHARAMQAAEDEPAARKALEGINKACASCHKDHK
jgi:hypothetical protein